jgi:predicted phage terminase large subunit-like protein
MRQWREQSPYFYAAQVQQRPRPREGVMFPRPLATIVDAAPAGLRWLRYWDKAGTEGGGAFTAGVKMAVDPDGLIYIGDVKRAQHAALLRRKLMRQTAELDGVEVEHVIEQEPGSSGKDSSGDDIRNLAGYSVSSKPASGDKVLRADPFASQWQAGNVRLVRGDWNKAYLDETEGFPHAKLKDQTDASSGAYNELAGTGGLWVI